MAEPTSITYSGGIAYLRYALDEHSRSLCQLRMAMDSFVPLPMEAFAEKRLAEIHRVKAINPPENADQIEEMVNRDFYIGYSPELQFWQRFEKEFPAVMVMITLTSHALCEAVINADLAIGLHYVGKSKLFSVLEKSSLLDKWTSAPLKFNDLYKLSKSGKMFETLKALCKLRNTLTHQKIQLQNENGETVYAGNQAGTISMEPKDRLQLGCFTILPYALQAHMLSQLDGTPLARFLDNILKNTGKQTESGEALLNAVT